MPFHRIILTTVEYQLVLNGKYQGLFFMCSTMHMQQIRLFINLLRVLLIWFELNVRFFSQNKCSRITHNSCTRYRRSLISIHCQKQNKIQILYVGSQLHQLMTDLHHIFTMVLTRHQFVTMYFYKKNVLRGLQIFMQQNIYCKVVG